MATFLQKQPSPELEQVEKYWQTMQTDSPIYHFLLSDILLVKASKGSFTAMLKVKPSHLNSKKTLHGAVSACLTDWAGGLAIASHGRDMTGVSTDIHTTFVSTAQEGDLLEIEGRVVKLGGTLAFTTMEIRKVGEDGAGNVVATGSHTKYVKL